MKMIATQLIVVALITAVGQTLIPAQPRLLAKNDCTLCLYGPDNMVIDARGNLYLVDTDHRTRSRILKLTRSGAKLAEWEIFTPSANLRNGPEGIALDRKGNILVTDGGANRILELSQTGVVLRIFGGSQRAFVDLGHIAVLPNGRILVSEADPNRIQEFSSSGRRITSWVRPRGKGQDAWNRPEAIVSLGDGSFAVEDWGNRRIEILSPAGRLLRVLGGLGNGPGELMNSAGLAVDPLGHVYVVDYALKKVVEFDSTGQLISEIGDTAGRVIFVEGPGGLALDSDGNFYSPDGLSIVKFSREGRVLARWR